MLRRLTFFNFLIFSLLGLNSCFQGELEVKSFKPVRLAKVKQCSARYEGKFELLKERLQAASSVGSCLSSEKEDIDKRIQDVSSVIESLKEHIKKAEKGKYRSFEAYGESDAAKKDLEGLVDGFMFVRSKLSYCRASDLFTASKDIDLGDELNKQLAHVMGDSFLGGSHSKLEGLTRNKSLEMLKVRNEFLRNIQTTLSSRKYISEEDEEDPCEDLVAVKKQEDKKQGGFVGDFDLDYIENDISKNAIAYTLGKKLLSNTFGDDGFRDNFEKSLNKLKKMIIFSF